ncbi:hypothetical protein C2S52_005385 [Perilla frutescens var. hirtella]|nr:hypothetical protein C2S52_005385 [Perilla frutescens var. hirtella]
MSPAHLNHGPSFCKMFGNLTYINEMPLSETASEMYEVNRHKTALLKDYAGHEWKVMVVRNKLEDQLWLTDGWHEVAMDRVPIAFLDKYASTELSSRLHLLGDGVYKDDVDVELIHGEFCLTNGWESFMSACNVRQMDRLTFRSIGPSMRQCMSQTEYVLAMAATTSHEAGPPTAPAHHKRLRFVQKFSGYQIEHTYLEIPKKFVEDAGMVPLVEVQLENGEGLRWNARLVMRANNKGVRFFLTDGWREFAQEAKLGAGDYVMFSLMRVDPNVIRTVQIEYREGLKLVSRASNGGYLTS